MASTSSILYIGENFNPEVGFLRREDIRKTSGNFRFSPRPSFHRGHPQDRLRSKIRLRYDHG